MDETRTARRDDAGDSEPPHSSADSPTPGVESASPWASIPEADAMPRGATVPRETSAASATSTPSGSSAASGPGEPDDPSAEPGNESDPTPAKSRTWMGITSFVTAILGFSIVAIVLGHLGWHAARHGRARHGAFAIAGTILGWLGLLLTAAAAWFYVQDPAPEQVDIQARQDIHAVGAEVATQAVETGAVPEVTMTDESYMVGAVDVPQELVTEHSISITGTATAEWCVELTYSGGEVGTYSYDAQAGVAEGSCN